MSMTKAVETRIKDFLKRYQPVIQEKKDNNDNESETSRVIEKILSDVFGYDPFLDITTEHKVRNKFCDYAIKKGNEVETMIEVKRIGQNLKEDHLEQVERYALNEGCDWAVLTNGQHWKIYALELVSGRIQTQEVYAFDLLEMDCKNKSDIEMLYRLTKEGRSKGELDTHHQKKKARDQFTVAALLMHDNIVKKIRSELKKVSDGVILTDEEIRNTLQKDVIKQTILAGDEAKKAKTFVTRKLNQSEKKRQQKKSASKTQVEKLDIEPSVPVAPPVQATETTTVTESPQGTGV
jgi:hypothetical protein